LIVVHVKVTTGHLNNIVVHGLVGVLKSLEVGVLEGEHGTRVLSVLITSTDIHEEAHVDCAGESAGLSQHCESVVKVSYVVLGLLFVKEHGLVASEHLSGVVLGNAVSGGASVDAVKQLVKNAGSGLANESCGEFPGLNKLLVHMRFCQGGPTPRQKR